MATFNYKFTGPETGKQRTAWLGVYNPETFTVENARSKVYGLKAKGGTAIAETLRQHKVQKVKQGRTVGEIIEERIEWMKTPVLKRDGEMRPRIESWENVARHLRRFVGPRLGKKIASEVSKNDIATLSNDIVAGKLGVPSVANARHMRRAASGLFNWAAEAGRDYVTAKRNRISEPSGPVLTLNGHWRRKPLSQQIVALTASRPLRQSGYGMLIEVHYQLSDLVFRPVSS